MTTSCRPVFFAAVAAATVILPVAAPSAQTVDQLLADRALLRAELDRCKQLGMASNDDPRCRTARTAEQKRFFGNGVGYTQAPVTVTPGQPVPPITSDPPPRTTRPERGQ